MYKKIIFLLILSLSTVNAEILQKCNWDNRKGIPCITIQKTPNTSYLSESGVIKKVITKQEILNSGANDTNDILRLISGIDVFQSGTKGQQTSIFTRGSESNHTLVMLNGIAINDQSVTDGLHDFGQDFIQTIQQVEVYKGSNGANFGPNAIAGAINFITAIDYSNAFSVNGFDQQNNSFDNNYTKITNNGWHLNFKGSVSNNKTDSAIADGKEKDASKNLQVNLNSEKLINDNLKFKSTLYSRNTKSDYDNNSTDETGYKADNSMYAFQTSLEHISKNSEGSLIFHYHNYDREYENGGFLDEYDSESIVVKLEQKNNSNDKFSFGYGSEYKYDWGAFENRGSYSASTKGHMKDLGFFANIGFIIAEKSNLSFYGRTDDHNTTGGNQTYKINFTQYIDKFKFGATHATGLRNPTLYELYGTSSTGYKGSTDINPEKSKTNELYFEYNIFENFKLSSTAYRTSIFDQIELDSSWTANENKFIDINQEGLENELFFYGDNQSFSIFNNFSKSRKTNGQIQNRRPGLTYGANYSKKFTNNSVGAFSLNLNYRHTGKYNDWTGSKNEFVKSTDLFDLSITKNLFGNALYLKVNNLLNERYERPATYSKEGRQLRLGLRKLY